MNRWLILLPLFYTMNAAYAVDATNLISESENVGDWEITEFAGESQLLYRISSDSVNSANKHLTFDFIPSKGCVPDPVIMIMKFDSYKESFNNGLLPLAYKVPSQKQNVEFTKTNMSEGDVFAFFIFEKLTVNTLLQAKDKGRLAIWVPASGDGEIKGSGNMYFSLKGFSHASKKARKLCLDNK